MKNFNVVKLDSKGRIILPYHVREYMGLKEGVELLISNNEKKELRIFPLISGTAEMRIVMTDIPGSLSKILTSIARSKIDILMSTSKTIEKGKLAEWNAIIDTTHCKDTRKLESELKRMPVVKKLEMKLKIE
jgi:AbrB family looped-hinge helix DNA binding protein